MTRWIWEWSVVSPKALSCHLNSSSGKARYKKPMQAFDKNKTLTKKTFHHFSQVIPKLSISNRPTVPMSSLLLFTRVSRAHGVGVTMYGFGDLRPTFFGPAASAWVCRSRNRGSLNGTCVEGDEWNLMQIYGNLQRFVEKLTWKWKNSHE